MRQRDDMTFPFEEYQRRLGELQQRMRERLLDAVIISDPENIMYLTDYQTTGYSWFQALVVPVDGDAVMSTRELEESNVVARTWVEKTRAYSVTGDAMQMLHQILREIGVEDGTVGYERNSYFFPAYFQDRIRGLFRKGRLQDCFGIVEEGRMCKSHHEIEIMQRAARATEAGMLAGIEAVQEGDQ
jgi:Xaa-Pro dipeptidase